MAENKRKTYWPHMILGFFMLGITLGYWTVKSANSVPVHESNDFMMKYQQADINYNDIIQKKEAFDKRYRITLTGTDRIKLPTDSDFHRPVEDPVKLTKGKNTFHYVIESHEGSALEDANVTFELTRPHTTEDDQLFRDIQGANGIYVIKDVNISKPGRYTLRLKAAVDEDTVGYSDLPAYLNP